MGAQFGPEQQGGRPGALSTVVEDHVRRLDAAIYGLCPIQDTARAILGIEEIRDNFEHHGS
jgi:hypothetical protein